MILPANIELPAVTFNAVFAVVPPEAVNCNAMFVDKVPA